MLSDETEGQRTRSVLFADLRLQSARQVKSLANAYTRTISDFPGLDLLLILYVTFTRSLVLLADLYLLKCILHRTLLFLIVFAFYDTTQRRTERDYVTILNTPLERVYSGPSRPTPPTPP